MSGLLNDVPDEVSDPSDWKMTKFPNLSDLDSALRCQICKEFLKAPVLTSCGHIFCSICIRRTISTVNKCPICLEETYESGLRKLLLLDSIAKWFNLNRGGLAKALEIDQVNDSQNEECCETAITESVEQSAENKDQRQQEKEAEAAQESDNATENTNKARVENGDFGECPICGVFMDVKELQTSHIDRCLSNPGNSKQERQATDRRTVTGFFHKSASSRNDKEKHSVQVQQASVRAKHRLPSLDTSISTVKLREKLHSLNISKQGSRGQMEQRMKEYINLYNANLDSIHPVSDAVLIDRLRKWETLINKTTATAKTSNSPPVTHDGPSIKRQKLERVSWNSKNRDQYAELIQQAKRNMKKQKSHAKTQTQTQADAENATGSRGDTDFSDNDSELLL